MRITVNDDVMIFTKPLTVSALLAHLERPVTGVAVAVNQSIAVRDEWSNFIINDGDQVLLFQAIAGG